MSLSSDRCVTLIVWGSERARLAKELEKQREAEEEKARIAELEVRKSPINLLYH
jgi:hypothetical protein